MSREKKERERNERKRMYRAECEARVLRTKSMSSESDVQACIAEVKKHLNALPGKPEEKYAVILRCGDGGFYSYPIYGCSDGFTAAMQDAIGKHQNAGRAPIQGGLVQGIGNMVYQPPDFLVQAMAMGAKVLVTNRLENRRTDDQTLRGIFGMGGLQ